MKNISVKVAVGYAFVPSDKATWQGQDIPAGYARVGVDQIVPSFETMELDIPGPEGQPTLGECLGEIILWNKKNIKFPSSATIMPPPPPSHRRSPSPPPRSPSPPPRSPHHDYNHHSASPSQSPVTDRPSSPPPAPTKDKKGPKQRKRGNAAPSMSCKLPPLPKIPKGPPILPWDRAKVSPRTQS